jgi:hypothetical protein
MADSYKKLTFKLAIIMTIASLNVVYHGVKFFFAHAMRFASAATFDSALLPLPGRHRN